MEGFTGKTQKAMETLKMPPDFWMAIEKGIQQYTRNVSENNKGGASPFRGTFNTTSNLLRWTFRDQGEIGRWGLFKRRVATE
jgi:hypothetical protein